jgi:hypothetical protein
MILLKPTSSNLGVMLKLFVQELAYENTAFYKIGFFDDKTKFVKKTARKWGNVTRISH